MTRVSVLLLAIMALGSFSGKSSALTCSQIGNDLCLLNIGIASTQCNFAVSTSGVWPSADICIDLLNGAVSSCIMCDELRSSICNLMSTATNLLSSVADSRLDTYRRLASQCQGVNGANTTVTSSTELPSEELRVVALRKKKFIGAWAKLTGTTLLPSQVPRIGLAASGGGWKAALALIGALKGLDETGLLDLVTYMTTLSGSTWTAFPWVLSQKTPAEFGASLTPRLNKPDAKNDVEAILDCDDFSFINLFNKIQSKAKCGQTVSTMDLWGNLVSCRSLAASGVSQWLDTPMSALQPIVESGRVPFQIGTLIHVKENAPALSFAQWTEVTPWHFEMPTYGKRIPVDHAGSFYSEGQELVTVCPTTLASWLGAFGSVFQGTFLDGLASFNSSLTGNIATIVNTIKKVWPSVLDVRPGDVTRLSKPKRINNFLNGDAQIAAAFPDHPVASETVLRVIDAAMSSNVPLPPLLRRNLDVILIIDVTASTPGQDLRKAAAWAKANNVPFQPLNVDFKFSPGFYVFDEDKTIAPLIYMLMENTLELNFASTNWNATQAAASQRSHYNHIIKNVDKIKAIISGAIAKLT